MPRKPHLKPKPNAADDSGSNTKDASFNCNLNMASLSSSKSSVSTGKIPANTIGFTSSKP